MRAYFLLLLVVSLILGCSDAPVDQAEQSGENASANGKNDTVVEGEGMAGNVDESDIGDESDETISEGEDLVDGDLEEPADTQEPMDFEEGQSEDGEETGDTEEVLDPFADALDVTKHRIEFPEGTEAPDYVYPRAESFRLGGTEFWQKWEGGQNPTYSYSEGSEAGKRCMYASARRFEAIMANPPESLLALKENSNWSGSFFNWNDDFTDSGWGDGRSARLWAWRTSLVKWISQTNQDGSCFLPTLEMVEELAESCGERAESRDGEIQGCSAS